MFFLYNIKNKITIFVTIFLLSFSLAARSDDTIDTILKQADLPSLIGTDRAVNLGAQFQDPNASTTDVNMFNDFIAIGVLPVLITHTNFASFDSNQTVLKKATRYQSWFGVDSYRQAEIPDVTLQDGLVAVQSCMAKRHNPTPSNQVANVIIYKTLNTARMIYDYAFIDPSLSPGNCQEILYTPATKTCEVGGVTACHIDFVSLNH